MLPDISSHGLLPTRHLHGGAKRSRWVVARYAFLLILLLYPASWLYRKHLWRRDLQHEEVEGVCAAKISDAGLDYDRRRIYGSMGQGISSKGLQVGGIITQGLKQEDLFRFTTAVEAGTVVSPILHQLDVPVRAMVLPLTDKGVAATMRHAVDKELLQLYAPDSIWAQDHNIYHSTLYHASSHTNPVQADRVAIDKEEAVIRAVARQFCPIQAVLDRFIATSSGVIVACWQVLPTGGEPAVLRQALGAALPNAPPKEGQMVREPAILHTTVARLLSPLKSPSGQIIEPNAAQLAQAAERMTAELCGTKATFDAMWFVEEKDLLALALRGEYVVHNCPFQCNTL